MALINKAVGARLHFGIGHRGEARDIYDGVLISQPTVSFTPKGPVETATIIIERQTRDGVTILDERLANLRYCWDRSTRNERLDGTQNDPKTTLQVVAEQMEQLDAYLSSRNSAAASGAPTGMAEAVSAEVAPEAF